MRSTTSPINRGVRHVIDKLETIKDLIEWHGLEGDLHGSHLEEVYRLVIELIEEETCAETSSCTKALEA